MISTKRFKELYPRADRYQIEPSRNYTRITPEIIKDFDGVLIREKYWLDWNNQPRTYTFRMGNADVKRLSNKYRIFIWNLSKSHWA